MSENLKNAGLEADWGDEQSHHCLVCPRTEPNYEKNVGNIFVPPGWTFWYRHQPNKKEVNKGYDQPEGRDSWKQNAPERVLDGDKAYMWFTFNRRHDAGLFQRVEVGAGNRVRFSVWAHAWSNGLSEADGGKPDNGLWSDGAAFAHVAWKAPLPHATGSKWEDAKANFTFWVGIDPSGGTDPYSPGVIWGDGYHIYNGYAKRLEAEATALADTITVFIRSKTRWAFKHNDAYVDNAELIVLDDPVPDEIVLTFDPQTPNVWDYVNLVARSTAELEDVQFLLALEGEGIPLSKQESGKDSVGYWWQCWFRPSRAGLYSASVTSSTCGAIISFYVSRPRGSPREQYERTYVLLPPDAGADWARAVVEGAWDDHRFTFGGSADDAGIGNLDARRVVAVNPGNWHGETTLAEFFELYYPGVEYVPVEVETPQELQEVLRCLV